MILGGRIRLRAIEKTDLPLFVAWLNDPEVRRNLSIYLPGSMDQEEQWFEDLKDRSAEERPLVIEVDTPEGWITIGDTSFFNVDRHNQSAEIGIIIGDKHYWNKGYGRDTMKLMLKHGFNTLNLNRIYLQVYETNPGGIRAYEHAGFKHEGRMRQAAFKEGKYIDFLLMSVIRSEWSERDSA